MKRILCLWLPNWPIQRLRIARPELSPSNADPPSPDPPLVLYETGPRGEQTVAACSASAHRLGVEIGMPLVEAAALCDRGSGSGGSGSRGSSSRRSSASKSARRPRRQLAAGWHWIEADRWEDRLALERLAQWCHQFSPSIALEEAAWPERLLLDVTGVGRLFGGEPALLDRAHSALTARGYHSRLALADTLGAAWAVARFGPPAAGPVQIVPPDQLWTALAPLPIAALRLPEQAVERLTQLGIIRIEQLAALPRDSLRSRLGPEVLRRLDQALGQAPEAVDSQLPAAQFAARWTPPTAVEHADSIDRAVLELCQQVAAQLRTAQRGAVRLICRLTDADGRAHSLAVGFFQPTAQPRRWQELLDLELQKLRLNSGVAEIELLAARDEPLAQRQQQLFDQTQQAARQQTELAHLAERLASRLGHQAVVRPRLVADAQPEWACRCQPLVGAVVRLPKTGKRSSTGKPASSAPNRDRPPSPLQRPLCLWRRPIPTEVVTVAPHGRPQRFRFRGHWLSIARSWGPERIEIGWQRGRGVRRDYWRIETAAAERWWLMRDLRSRKWFVHGAFW